MAAPIFPRLRGLLFFTLAVAGCSRTVSVAQVSSAVPNGASALQVLDTRCGSCHGGTRAEAGLRLDTWEHAMAGSSFGAVVVPFDPDGSLLLRLVSGHGGMMPHPLDVDVPSITDEELETLRAWVAGGARSAEGRVPFSGDRDFVYVCNQGAATISVIDAEAKVVARTIDLQELGFPATAKPHHVAVEPDGSFWYVTLIGANRVVKFNRDNEIVGTTEFRVPGLLALDPHSDQLYVGRSMSAVNPPQSIGRISRSTMTLEEEIDVFFPRPHALVLSPDGRMVHVASLGENRAISIDMNTGDAQFTDLPGPVHTLVQFATNPRTGELIAGGQLTAQLFTLAPTSAGGLDIESTTTVEGQPWHPVFSADGSTAWIPNKGSNGVTVWDATSDSVRAVIHGGGLAQPHGSSLSHDGRYLFVSNSNMEGVYQPRYSWGGMSDHSGMNEMPGMTGMATVPGTVVVIDTVTNEIVKVIEIGLSPTGMGSRGPSVVR